MGRVSSWVRSFARAMALLLAMAFGVATAATAGELHFDKARFDAELAAARPVVVAFHADWCPTCKAQKPVVNALLKDPKLKGLTLFVADFDKEPALKKRLGVTMQSTFVVFKGGKEVARSTGQTDRKALADLFAMAL